MNEAELIKLCLEKDKKAWSIFIERYSRLVYWSIRKRLLISGFQCDESDIEDIFQEVFLMILRDKKLSQLKGAKFIPGWLAMVASNKTVDFIRKNSRREENLVVENEAFVDYSLGQDLFDQDIFKVVKEVIDTLSDKERIIITLNLLEEKTHGEIAGILRIPANTVSTVIARTKEKLRQGLKERAVKGDGSLLPNNLLSNNL